MATLEAVQKLLHQEADKASERAAASASSEGLQSLSGLPLAHEALSILQHSVDRHILRSESSAAVQRHSSMKPAQRTQTH